MAVEGSEYRRLAVVPTDPLYSTHSSAADGCPWRRESIKRYTGMEKAVDWHGREHRTDDVLTRVLRELKQQGEAALKAPIRGVAVSVPPCFTDRQKAASKRCAEAAGFATVALVDDSQAAALDYAVKTKQRGKWLLYGLGRSVFFATLLDSTQARHHNGDSHLGGDDLDALIVDQLVREGLADQTRAPLQDMRLCHQVFEAAEKCKLLLSTQDEVRAAVSWPAGDRAPQFSIRRVDFERWIGPRIEETVRMAELTAREDGLRLEEMDRILLLGGSTKIPLIRRRLEKLCPNGVVELADDAVVRGAALYSTTLVGACFERGVAVRSEPAGMPPRMVEAWRKVDLAHEQGAPDEAIKLYEQFLGLAREGLSGLYQRRAAQLADAGQEDQAKEMLEKGLEYWPANPAIRERLAEYYLRYAALRLADACRTRKWKEYKEQAKFCEQYIDKSLEYLPRNPRAAELRERLRIEREARR
jgi:tetratricopeptide (TPR) repeat protein